MRILWLCSTPALGAEIVGAPAAQVGGWVAALEGAVKQYTEVELSIGFPWDEPTVRRIQVDRHEYLPFPRYPRGGRLQRLLVDASCRLEPPSEIDHLQRIIELSRPDLIHVWGTETFFGLVADRTDLPVLIDIQGPRTPYTHAYFAGLTKKDVVRYGSLKHLMNGRSLLHRYYRYRRSAARERHMLGLARFVSGRTDWDHQICRTLAPQARYFHCDRVLRPDFYRVQWRRRPAAEPLRIVSTLRGNTYKGVETVARCAALLQAMLSRGFSWTLVGIRPGEEIHRIIERKLGVSFDQLGIHLPGRKSADQVAGQLLESDLYVLPSRIENSPNGLCEAMMVGLPIVSTNSGGTPSLVDHDKEALLVPPGDPWAMAGAIQQIAKDTELGDRLASASRELALRRHDPAAVAQRVMSIYRVILDGKW